MTQYFSFLFSRFITYSECFFIMNHSQDGYAIDILYEIEH